MKFIASFIFTLTAIFSPNLIAQDESSAIKQASLSAESWLQLVDSSRFPDSWQQSSALFQASISQSNWEKALETVRSPLGKVTSRTLKSAYFTNNLPGVPEGDYVIIQYQTDFEYKADAVETITPVKEHDGSWKVFGYFIR